MRKARRWEISKMAIVDGELASEAIGVGYAFESWLLEDGCLAEPGGVVLRADVKARTAFPRRALRGDTEEIRLVQLGISRRATLSGRFPHRSSCRRR